MVWVCTQSGVDFGSRFLWKNGRCGRSAVPTPLGQRLRVAGRRAACGTNQGATAW